VTISLVPISLVVAALRPHGTLTFISLAFAAVNLILLMQILIPRKLTIGSGETSSDFLLIKQVRSAPEAEIEDWVFGRFYCESADCQKRGDFAAAQKWLLQGLQERPADLACLSELGSVQYALGSIETARQTWKHWLELAPGGSLDRPYILNAVATCGLTGGPDVLIAAERCADEALAAMPWVPDFLETKGRLLDARDRLSRASAPSA